MAQSKQAAPIVSAPGKNFLNFGPYEQWYFSNAGGKYRPEKKVTADSKGVAFLATGIFSEPVFPLPKPSKLSVKLPSYITRSNGNEPDPVTRTMTSVALAEGATGEQVGGPYSVMPMTLYVEPNNEDGEKIFRLNQVDAKFFGLAASDPDLFDIFPKSADDFKDLITGIQSSEARLLDQPDSAKEQTIVHQVGLPRVSLDFRLSHPMPADRINLGYDVGSTPALRTLPTKASKVVIVGVIDDGLPFANRNFLGTEPGQTRIDYLWLQGTRAGNPVHVGKKTLADDNVAFGKELVGEAIDKLWDEHCGDEDAIYDDPRSGAIVTDDPDVSRNIFNGFSHGAHVMDLAAGMMPDDDLFDQRDQIRVVGVQLPRTALADTSGFGKEAFILAGVHYILDRAHHIAKSLGAKKTTALINVSLGVTGGPKNGLYYVERGIDEVVTAFDNKILSDVKVFLPSGNNFESRMAADAKLTEKNLSASLDWKLQPNDRTENIVEIWLDSNEHLNETRSGIKFTLTSPQGDFTFDLSNPSKILVDKADTFIAILENNSGDQIGQVSLDWVARRYRFMVILAPTEFDVDENPPVVPAGKWTLKFTSTPAYLKKFDKSEIDLFAIVQRDEDPAGTYNGGRQSYFVDTGYNTHNIEGRRIADEEHKQADGKFAVSGFRTINGWATNSKSNNNPARLAVAGFTVEKTSEQGFEILEPATYSAAGARNDLPPAIDTSAQSNRSSLMPGVLGSGTRSDSTQILVGTSAAAPSVLRQRALQFLKDEKPRRLPREKRLGVPTFGCRKKA